MKRFFIAVSVIIALTATATAQEPSQNFLGIKGGVNYVKIYSDDFDFQSITSYAAGAFYQYRVNERFAVSPEVYYSLMGAKMETEAGDVDWDLAYIQVPLLFKLMFPTGNTITPCLYAGGYLGFLMSAKVEEVDVKGDLNSTDYGLVIGASLDMAVSGGRQLVNLDVRYLYGTAYLREEGMGSAYNGGFQFLLGWGFSL